MRAHTPRGMVVSAYRNVVINNFILVGDPDYDYEENPMISVQYRARNVTLNNITLLNFKKAGQILRYLAEIIGRIMLLSKILR